MTKAFCSFAIASVLAVGLGQPTFGQEDLARVAAVQSGAAGALPDGACHDGHEGPVLQLVMQDLKKREGQFRIELYPDDPDLFLEGKGRIYKYFAPVPDEEDAPICVTVPSVGDYGLLVIHDRDMDDAPDFFSDGFGLSTNPKLQLKRPSLDEALFTVAEDETVLEIKLQYVTGSQKKKCRGKRCR